MSNLTTLTGSARTVVLAGESYQVYPLTLADLGELQAWLDTQLPDPLALVRRHIDAANVPMEQAKFLYAEALREASKTRIHLSSPEALPYINGANGVIELLFLAIRKGRPNWSRDQARTVFESLTPADIQRLQSLTELDQVVPEVDAGEAKAAG
jgi:hypothetical protein